MNNDPVDVRIAHLKAIKEAVEKADAVCLSELELLRQELAAIQAKVPEAKLLAPPSVSERREMPRTDISADDDGNWHSYSAPKLSCIDGDITFNPMRRTWTIRERGPHGSSRQDHRAALLDAFADRVARWTIHEYPGVRKALDDELQAREAVRSWQAKEDEKKAAAEAERARREAESDERTDAYFQEAGQRTLWGFAAALVFLLLVVPAMTMCMSN